MNQKESPSQSPHVLCVLQPEQHAALSKTLDLANRPGVRIAFEESADDALDQLDSASPAIVLVGMNLDTMEGLEFVALHLKRHPGFSGKVVVVPEEGDPFPPVAQYRDVASGKSITEQTDLATVAGWLDALGTPERPASPEPVKAAPAPSAAKAAPTVPAASPAKTAPAAPAKTEPAAPAAKAPTVPAAKAAPTVPAAKAAPTVPAAKAAPTVPAVKAAPAKSLGTPAQMPAAHRPPTPRAAKPPPGEPPVTVGPRAAAPRAVEPRPAAPVPAAPVAPARATPLAVDPLATTQAVASAQPAAAEPHRLGPAAAVAPMLATPPRDVEAHVANARPPVASGLTKRRMVIGAIIIGIIVLLILLIGLVTIGHGASREATPAKTAKAATTSIPAVKTNAAPEPPAAVHPPPAVGVDPDLRAMTRLPFQFEKGSAQGTVQSASQLEHLVGVVRSRLDSEPAKSLEVGGHASAEGPEYLHQKLGEERAEYAVRYLVEHGIPEDRIILRNYAATRPVTDKNGEDLVASRRVTVRLVDTRR